MNGLTYTIRLLEPLLASTLEGDPNSNTSLPYVPGGLVRGALIAAYQGEKKLNDLDATDDELRRLFLDGSTRFLHAYPGVDGRRSLPTPLSWRSPKHQQDQIFDLSLHLQVIEEPKAVSGYGLAMGEQATLAELIWQVNVHTQRDAVLGHAAEGQGAVYRSQALAAGQTFLGIILTQTEQDAQQLNRFMNRQEHLLGGARTAGYGRVIFEKIAGLPTLWQELEPGVFDRAEYTQVLVHCLSDVILRNAHGQYSLDLPNALGRRLGGEVRIVQRGGQDLAFCNSTLVGGFNRKWNLPLQQAQALQAGSTYVLAFFPPVKGSNLLALQERGIGERLAEGFGRLAFLELPSSESDSGLMSVLQRHSMTVDQPVVSGEIAMSETDTSLGQLLLTRLLRQDLEERLSVTLNQIEIKGRVSTSQLARWRVLARDVLATRKPERMVTFLERQQQRRTRAWVEIERARVIATGGSQRLSEWIETLVRNNQEVWNYISRPRERSLGQGLQTNLTSDLTFEFAIRLLDGVLAKAARKQAES